MGLRDLIEYRLFVINTYLLAPLILGETYILVPVQ
jgi:hypothetical protein